MPLPIISVAQMREWEKATWAAGQSQNVVIKKVGETVAHWVLKFTRPADTIVLLAGKGHNGDDVRAAQPHLAERHVELIDVTDPKTAVPVLAKAVASVKVTGLRARTWIVDGLFGIGLDRPLDADWVKLVEAVNGSRLPVFSVDVPSGLNAETGEVEGAAIRAAVTLTVGAPKKGLLTAKGRAFVGRLIVADDIGLVSCPVSGDLNWTQASDFNNFFSRRLEESNKGGYGHVNICAGSLGYHGAAVLATRAALRAQPGLVTVFPQATAYIPVASQLQAAMVRPWQARTVPLKKASALLIGPGLAAADLSLDMKNEARFLWGDAECPVIVDASALDWLIPKAGPQGSIRVLTPHPGEAARILSTSVEQVQSDRLGALRTISKSYGDAIVVLKGNQTLVGRASGPVFVNSTGNPLLAQGGTGDILAGYIAGLLAQPELQKDPLLTVRFAVWQHGLAADRLCQVKANWIPDDLVDYLGLEENA